MFLSNCTKDAIPVRSTKVSGCPERSDSVFLSTDVLDDDVVHLVFPEFSGQVYVDLNAVLGVLLLDSVKQGMEPFSSAEVANDPSEVDLEYAVSLSGGSAEDGLTLERRVGFESWRLFMRYQMDLRILWRSSQRKIPPRRQVMN